MGKFSGVIGFVEHVETSPGVYVEQPGEFKVYGDILKNYYKLREGTYGNTDIDVNNEYRFVISERNRRHLSSMRYITVKGVKWRITSYDPSTYPSVTVQVGGVYNENTYRVSN